MLLFTDQCSRACSTTFAVAYIINRRGLFIELQLAGVTVQDDASGLSREVESAGTVSAAGSWLTHLPQHYAHSLASCCSSDSTTLHISPNSLTPDPVLHSLAQVTSTLIAMSSQPSASAQGASWPVAPQIDGEAMLTIFVHKSITYADTSSIPNSLYCDGSMLAILGRAILEASYTFILVNKRMKADEIEVSPVGGGHVCRSITSFVADQACRAPRTG